MPAPVIALALSPDGRRVVSGSLDKTVKVWDGGTLQFVRTLGTHAGSVVSVAFSRNGRTIVSGGLDGSIKVWDAVTMQPARTISGHIGRPAPLGAFASGILSGIGSHDFSGAVSEAASWILSGGVPGVLALAFLPDGRIVSAGGDRSLKLWDAATLQLVRTIEGHADVMASLAFSPDGRRIASASADSTIRIWDAGTLRLVRKPARSCRRGVLGRVVAGRTAHRVGQPRPDRPALVGGQRVRPRPRSKGMRTRSPRSHSRPTGARSCLAASIA